MIDYIKFLVLAIFSGITAPLPISSSAQFSFMNSVLDFSHDQNVLGFYYSVFMLVFSVVIFICLRKIYINILKFGFKKTKNKAEIAYKARFRNILLSLIPSLLLFIPVSKDSFLCDYFDRFISPESLLVVCASSVLCGFFLIISIWYTSKRDGKSKRGASTRDVMRMSAYNLVSQIIPGLSKISLSTTNLLICDVDSKVIAREIYLYIAPQVFFFNLIKLIRELLSGIVIDPVLLIIAIVTVFLTSMLVITLVGKINVRRLFTFFSVYSIAFGVFLGVITFLI